MLLTRSAWRLDYKRGISFAPPCRRLALTILHQEASRRGSGRDSLRWLGGAHAQIADSARGPESLPASGNVTLRNAAIVREVPR
jgi:hypothetical protein